MPDSWWIVLGAGAGYFGVLHLEQARRGNTLKPAAVARALLAAYIVWEQGTWLYAAGEALRLAALALVLCAVSPLLGLVAYGYAGAIRRLLLKSLFALVIAVIGTLVAARFMLLEAALVVGAVTAIVAFLPYGELKHWLSARKRHRAERREQRTERKRQRQELRRQQRVQKELNVHRRLSRRTARELERQQQRLAALERGERTERERRATLRAEVCQQVRLIRQAEVQRLRNENAGLRFHEHHGFLMAEGWRVLRADLKTGFRESGLESDAFFFQVIDELLEDERFEERYLHEEGRIAIRGVNSYLAGSCPLARVHAEIAELELRPDMLAPVPLEGDDLVTALLKAWLRPHRRFQDRALELFEQGEHPQQEALEEFLEDFLEDFLDEQAGIPMPSRAEWRALWDEYPALFSPQHAEEDR